MPTPARLAALALSCLLTFAGCAKSPVQRAEDRLERQTVVYVPVDLPAFAAAATNAMARGQAANVSNTAPRLRPVDEGAHQVIPVWLDAADAPDATTLLETTPQQVLEIVREDPAIEVLVVGDGQPDPVRVARADFGLLLARLGFPPQRISRIVR